MKIKSLLKCVEDFVEITICYAANGHRLFKGTKDEGISEWLLEYYITLLIPGNDRLYIEAHENSHFMDE